MLVSYSYSTASFTNYLSAKKLSAHNLSIITDYDSIVESDVTPSRGGAIAISLGTVKTNLAIAESNSEGSTIIDIEDDIQVVHDFKVGLDVNGSANATVNPTTFEASVAKVTTNVSTSKLTDSLNVLINGTGTLSAERVNVYSLYNDSNASGAISVVGGNDISNVSGSVSFIDVNTNVSNAYDYVNNELEIDGKLSIYASGDIDIEANTNGIANAKTKESTISVSAMSIGNMSTDAIVLDNTSVILSLGEVDSRNGNISIMAKGTPILESIADGPSVQVSAISETSINADGSIGKKSEAAGTNLVVSNANLYANSGNIYIESLYIPTKNEIGVNAVSESILSVKVNNLETKTYIYSGLEIGNVVSMHATKVSKNRNDGSDIQIICEAIPSSNIVTSGNNISIALSASDLEVRNTAVSTVNLSIGNDFDAYSSGRINIIGGSSAILNSFASGLTGGTISGSGVETYNGVERTVSVKVGDRANIYAYSAGEDALIIGAESGRKDNLNATIDDTVAGLVGISALEAITDISTNQSVTLGKDSYFMAINGTVTIESDYGINKLNNSIDSLTAGLASGMGGKANTTIDIKSNMDINYSDVNSDNTVYIAGQYANVLNYASRWDITNKLNMTNDSVSGNVVFENKLNVNLDVNNYISGTYIDGIKEAYLTASFMTPLLNNRNNFKSNNEAKVELASISTDAIKNACTDFWSKSNSSVNGKVVMNIGSVELYSTSENRYFTGCGYNLISGIPYTSTVDINNGGYTASNVLSANFNGTIKERKNRDGYAFLYFTHTSRNISVIDITDEGAIILDESGSTSLSSNRIEGDTIYLGELKSDMTSYSGYYKCNLSDLYIINRSGYNVSFDIITNTNNSKNPRGTITAYSLIGTDISISSQHDDYQSYHLYAEWLGMEGGYLNLGSSADVYVEINDSGNSIYGIDPSHMTSTSSKVSIDLSNLKGSYVSYSMNTTTSNSKGVIVSAQGIRSLEIHNNTSKEISINDVYADTYVRIYSLMKSNVSISNIEALGGVDIEFTEGGSLACSGTITSNTVRITGVDSLGTKENPIRLESKDSIDLDIESSGDVNIEFTNTDRNVKENDASLNIVSSTGNVYFKYIINNGEYGIVNMDIENISGSNVDIYFDNEKLTQSTTINIYSSSSIGVADITADALSIHHVNGICRMEMGSSDTPFEIAVNGKVTLNGIQKCYMSQLDGDIDLEVEKSKMTYFKSEAEYQEWLSNRMPELEYVLVANTNGSLHINSLSSGSNNDYSALAYWDKVVLNAKEDLTIDDGDCMVIDLSVNCSRNLTIGGTLDMHRYPSDIIMSLSGTATIGSILNAGAIDITANGPIMIEGNIYVADRLNLKSLTSTVTVKGSINQDTVVANIYDARNVNITAYGNIEIEKINPISKYTLTSMYGDVTINGSTEPSWIAFTMPKQINVEALNGSVYIRGNDTFYMNGGLNSTIRIAAKNDIYYYAYRDANTGVVSSSGNVMFKLFVGEVFDITSKTGKVYLGDIVIESSINRGNTSPGAQMKFKGDVWISSISCDASIVNIESSSDMEINSLSGSGGHYRINASGNVEINSFATTNGSLTISADGVILGTISGGQYLNVKSNGFNAKSINDVYNIDIKAKTVDMPSASISAKGAVFFEVETINIKEITASNVQITASTSAGSIDSPVLINSGFILFDTKNGSYETPTKVVIYAKDMVAIGSISTSKDLELSLENVILSGDITCANLCGNLNASSVNGITANSIEIQFVNAVVYGDVKSNEDLYAIGSATIYGDIAAKSIRFNLYGSKILGNITAEEAVLGLHSSSTIRSNYINVVDLSVTIDGDFGTKKNTIKLTAPTTNLSLSQSNGGVCVTANILNVVSSETWNDASIYVESNELYGYVGLAANQTVSLKANIIDVEITQSNIIYDTAIHFDSPSVSARLDGDHYIDMYFENTDTLSLNVNTKYLLATFDSNVSISGSIKTRELVINSKYDVTMNDLSIASIEDYSMVSISARSIASSNSFIKCGLNNYSALTINSEDDIVIDGMLEAESITITGKNIKINDIIQSGKNVSIEGNTVSVDGFVRGKSVSLTGDEIIVDGVYADTYIVKSTNKVSGRDNMASALYGYSGNIVELKLDILYSTIFNVKESSEITLKVSGMYDEYGSDIIESSLDLEYIYPDCITILGNTIVLKKDVTLRRPLVISSSGIIGAIDLNGYTITGTMIIDETSSKPILVKNGTLVLNSETSSPLTIINGYAELSNVTIRNDIGAAIFDINGKISVMSNSIVEGKIAIAFRLSSTISANGMTIKAISDGVENTYGFSSSLLEYLTSMNASRLSFIGSNRVDGMHDIDRFIKEGMTITYNASDVLENGAKVRFGEGYTSTSISITYEKAKADMGLYDNSISYNVPYRITYSDNTTSTGIITITLYDVTGGLDINATYIHSDGSTPYCLSYLPITFSGGEGYSAPMIRFTSLNKAGYTSYGVFTSEMFKYYFDGCTYKFFWDENLDENPDRMILEKTILDMDEVFKVKRYVSGEVVLYLNPNSLLEGLAPTISFENMGNASFSEPKFAFFVYSDHVPEAHIVNDYFTYTPEFTINEETGEVIFNTINVWDYLESFEVDNLRDYCDISVFVYGYQQVDPLFSLAENGDYTAVVSIFYGLDYTNLYLHFTVDNPTQYKITFIENGHERIEYHNRGEIIYGFGGDFVGYTFNGWYCDGVLNKHNIDTEVYEAGRGTVVQSLTVCVQSDMTFEARYTEGYPNGTITTDNVIFINGVKTTIKMSESPSQIFYAPKLEGYTFSHFEWAEKTSDGKYNFEFMSEEEYEYLSPHMVYSIVYTPNDVSVVVDEIEYIKKYGSEMTLSASTIEDKEFIGWYMGDTLLSKNKTYKFTVYSDQTITSRYSDIITIVIQSFDSMIEKKVTCGKTYAFTRETVNETRFIGWYLNDALIGSKDSIDVTFDYPCTLEARYEAINHNVAIKATSGITIDGESKANHFEDYMAVVSTTGCRRIDRSMITILLSSKSYDGFTFTEESGIITIPMDDITGDISIAISTDNIHTLEYHQTIDETCDKDGLRAYYSCGCGKYYLDSEGRTETTLDDIIIQKHHTLTHIDAVKETCITDGALAHDLCEKCGKLFIDDKEVTSSGLVIKAHHNFSNLIEGKDSTCITSGIESHYECTICHKYFSIDGYELITLELPLSGHDILNIDRIDATCAKDGVKAHQECSICGIKMLDGVEVSDNDLVINADHTPITKTETLEATCTTDGSITEITICSGCGIEISRTSTTKDKLGHSYTESVIDPTCTSEGYTTHTCTRCNDTYSDSTVPALGHKPSDWITDRIATDKQEGHEHKECLVCGQVIEERTTEKLKKKGCSGNLGTLSALSGLSALAGIIICIRKKKDIYY